MHSCGNDKRPHFHHPPRKKTIARSRMKQSVTITMVKPSLKKLSLSYCVQYCNFYSQPNMTNLKPPIPAYVGGDDVHTPIHIEKTIACSDVKH